MQGDAVASESSSSARHFRLPGELTGFDSPQEISKRLVCQVRSASDVYSHQPAFLTPAPRGNVRNPGLFGECPQAQDRPAREWSERCCIHRGRVRNYRPSVRANTSGTSSLPSHRSPGCAFSHFVHSPLFGPLTGSRYQRLPNPVRFRPIGRFRCPLDFFDFRREQPAEQPRFPRGTVREGWPTAFRFLAHRKIIGVRT